MNSSNIGSILIGVSIFTSVIFGFIIHSRFCKKKCPDCSSDVQKDVENTMHEVKQVVPRSMWISMGKNIIQTLTPRKQKIAETVLEAITEIQDNEASTSHS